MKSFKRMYVVTGVLFSLVAGASSVASAASLTMGLMQASTWEDAKAKCEAQGKRLPTARELADYGKFLGARGIVESSEAPSTPRILGADVEGNADQFSYLSAGYQGQVKSGAIIWSSSAPTLTAEQISSGYTVSQNVHYVFNTERGSLEPASDSLASGNVSVLLVCAADYINTAGVSESGSKASVPSEPQAVKPENASSALGAQ